MKNNDDVPLDPATRTFIDRMGIRFELDGLPRIAGQILGLMLVSPQPRSLDEIAQLVQVSKASVSSNTRLLERQGLVVRGARPGDRRDYYSVVTDLNARILEHRLGVMREMRSILEIGLETPGAADAAIRDRLTCATTCLGEAIEELTARAARESGNTTSERRIAASGGIRKRTRMKMKAAGAVLLALMLPAGVVAQVPVATDSAAVGLSIEAALARAMERSEEVRLAESRVDAARSQVRSARSSAFPEINTQLAYTKTLRSVFQGAAISLPDSLRFEPDSTVSLEERVSYLERQVPDAALESLGSLFSNLPFGNENTWIAGLSLAQPIFTGGRISSSVDMAEDAESAARAGIDEVRGDVAVQVKRAYYDAVLADRSAAIVETSADLAREHLAQVRLRLDAGRASELEVLRAEVEAGNLDPQLVQARNARELALLNLKRLINLPADQDVQLTTDLDSVTASGVPLSEVRLPTLAEAAAQLRQRASVRQAESLVSMREEQVDIARSAFLPSLALTGNMTRQAFPTDFGFPSGGDWRDDWNVGFVVQWPLFRGGRAMAEVDAAQAEVRTANLQLEQLREGVRLEYEQALGELQRAQAQIAAVARTVEQAQRVYELTELRYREGLATQLDVSNARLSLQQARINQVQAYHEAYSALARAEQALGVAVERTTLP